MTDLEISQVEALHDVVSYLEPRVMSIDEITFDVDCDPKITFTILCKDVFNLLRGLDKRFYLHTLEIDYINTAEEGAESVVTLVVLPR